MADIERLALVYHLTRYSTVKQLIEQGRKDFIPTYRVKVLQVIPNETTKNS